MKQRIKRSKGRPKGISIRSEDKQTDFTFQQDVFDAINREKAKGYDDDVTDYSYITPDPEQYKDDNIKPLDSEEE